MRLIYDDSIAVPSEISAATGIQHFGNLIYRRALLSDRVLSAAREAGITDVVYLRRPQDLETLLTRLRTGDATERTLYMPSHVIAAGPPDVMGEMLSKLRHVRHNAASTATRGTDRWSGVALCEPDMLRRLVERRQQDDLAGFMLEHIDAFARLDEGVPLVDLSDKAALLEFLTSHFEARHFNAIAYDRFTVRKTSGDVGKIRREYAYWGFLPEAMKRFFVQPYDFREQDGRASYAMERLTVPDMALQWIHGALDRQDFDRFLDRAFHFLQGRASRDVPLDQARAVQADLYVRKFDQRLEQLHQHPLWPRLNELLVTASRPDGLATIVARYRALLARLQPRRKDARLVVGHGDFCFSNILYDKTIGLMKLIDPRGAATEADLWTDPYYDAAKLSHSVLGNYDFFNNGLFDLTVDEALETQVRLTMQAPMADAASRVLERFFEAGFDPALVRLYEASLFLSMVPLHMDRPKKALAFLLTAEAVLEAAEGLS